MTKKHFIAIAAAFKTQFEKASDNPPAQAAIKECVDAFAGVAANDNPRFDTQRFLTACGIN